MCLFPRWSHIKGESLRERPHLIYLCFSFTTVHKTTWRHDVSCWWKVKVCRRSLHYLCHPAARTFNSIQSDHIKFSVYFLYFSFPFAAVHLNLNPHMCCSQLPTFTPIICLFQVKQFEMWRAVFIWSSSFFLAGYQSPPSENLGFSARWWHLKTKLASSQTSTSCWPTPGATLAEKQEAFGRLSVFFKNQQSLRYSAFLVSRRFDTNLLLDVSNVHVYQIICSTLTSTWCFF